MGRFTARTHLPCNPVKGFYALRNPSDLAGKLQRLLGLSVSGEGFGKVRGRTQRIRRVDESKTAPPLLAQLLVVRTVFLEHRRGDAVDGLDGFAKNRHRGRRCALGHGDGECFQFFRAAFPVLHAPGSLECAVESVRRIGQAGPHQLACETSQSPGLRRGVVAFKRSRP